MTTQLTAVRKGDWKLHLPIKEKVYAKFDVYAMDEDIYPLGETQLYNLKKDIGETKNVADRHPEIVQELLALAEETRNDIGDYDRIGKGARFFDPQPKRSDINNRNQPPKNSKKNRKKKRN